MLEECEICGQSTGKLYKCRICGVRFCRYCGSFTDRVCIDCVENSAADALDTPGSTKPERMGEVSR